MKPSLTTVFTIARINTKRFFRDRLAIFFTIAFPLIFLIIFGSLFGGDNNISFNIAFINQSDSDLAGQVEQQFKDSEILKVDETIKTYDQAQEKMKRSEIDSIIILPKEFGQPINGMPSGNIELHYNQNNAEAARALSSVIQVQMDEINKTLVDTSVPFTVKQISINAASLNQFDYTFAGMVGFAIIGLGIFGPTSVFPELKKQGVLRRLHTTPLKVWQYFVANVGSQGIIGLIAVTIMLVVSIIAFDLQMKGTYFAFFTFTLLGIIMIYGIGLAIGGWAKNERQAAPLSNLITFPMIFLSGTFFPRFIMPEWLQSITTYLPLTPVIDGIRLIVTEAKTLVDIAPQVGLISLWTLVIYAIAFKVFRWE